MKDEILIENDDIVVPGERLAQGMGFLPSKGTYRKDNEIIAQCLGIVRIDGKVIKLIPLSGCYVPQKDDFIIAEVSDVLMSGWRLNTFTPYDAVMNMRDASTGFIPKGADLTKYFAIGDIVFARITNVTSQKLVDASMTGPGVRKLKGGRILKIDPKKVPRVIGKKGSMVSLLKETTGCDIVVGQNGIVWLRGEPEQEMLAAKAIAKIEREAHKSGLTERIQKFLGESK